jgi:colicin import membrane protein
MPAVINVSMVTLPKEESAPRTREKPKTEKSTVSKPQEPRDQISTAPAKAPSVSKKKPLPKKSLKKKTFKAAEVVKNAISRIEKDVEKESPPPLEDALDRLRKEVGKTEVLDRIKQKVGEGKDSRKPGIPGGSNASSKKVLEIIDIYRVEIAYKVQKNWAFSGQLAGDSDHLQASLVFKVMPNGEIKDIFFTDRSGNRYLDESAYKAIVKSNPIDPHPAGISKPFINVGLRFTPEGVR